MEQKYGNNFYSLAPGLSTSADGAGVHVLNVFVLSFIGSCMLGQHNGFKLK